MKRKPVILDTDFNTDIDDAVALRILAHAHHTGLCRLLCVCMSTNAVAQSAGVTYDGACALDAALSYEGLSGTPIGVRSDEPPQGSFYYPVLCTFPHRIGSNAECPQSYRVYRHALSSLGRGERADIISVGYLTNLAQLWSSEPDDISPMTGRELIEEHVGTLWAMGGRYDTAAESPETNLAGYCRQHTLSASSLVMDRWQGKIVFVGQEMGTVLSGQSLIDRSDSTDPLYLSLCAYWTGREGTPCVKPRASWDPLTVLMAVRSPEQTGFSLVQGTNRMITDPAAPYYACNRFEKNEHGDHFYAVRDLPDSHYTEQLDSILVRPRHEFASPQG